MIVIHINMNKFYMYNHILLYDVIYILQTFVTKNNYVFQYIKEDHEDFRIQ